MNGVLGKDIEWGLVHFGVVVEDVMDAIRVGLDGGGTYVDVYFEHSVSSHVQLKDDSVDVASTQIEFGVGVRVLCGDRTGYAYAESVTREELLNAARSAAVIARGMKGGVMCSEMRELPRIENRYPERLRWEDVNIEGKRPWLEKLNARVCELDGRVKKVNVGMGDGRSHILFANSLGEMYYDFVPIAMMSVFCLMEDGNGRREQGGTSRSYHVGAEFLNDELVEELAEEAVRRTSILFDAVQPRGGEMEVVMGAGGSGILLHEAIGHAFEADFVRKGTSIFTDMLGKRICSEDVNIVDDGTIVGNRGSINYDDEGVVGQKTWIVKDGVLNSFLHDRISAGYFGVAPTGNGRRESFRHAPLPRMRATYMENGGCDEAEMIEGVKKGVYVDVFSNGQVQIGAGDFTFYVKSGWMIENGKLTQPIKDVNIIGNGPKALGDIVMVGNNSRIDNGTWTCGKDGQSAAVTCGMPSVRVRRLTVGGV